MTLSDTGKTAVHWTPAATSIADIAKLTAPAKITTSRSALPEAGLEASPPCSRATAWRRTASSCSSCSTFRPSTYMNAYLPSAACLPTTTRGRAQMLADAQRVPEAVPGSHRQRGSRSARPPSLSGVGFWNPVKTTAGAPKNGAELRPLLSVNITQGCGKF